MTDEGREGNLQTDLLMTYSFSENF